MKLSISIAIFAVVVFTLSCAFKITAQETESGPTPRNNKMKADTGMITGKVTFGPLRPGPARVEETPEDLEEKKKVLQEIYKSHKVAVMSADGKKTIGEVEIDKDGNYKAEVSPGTYQLRITPVQVRIQKQGVTVEVKAGKTVTADLSVDTGIR